MKKKTSTNNKTANGIKHNVSGRLILAIDKAGIHIRKTLYTTHHLDNGEVTYNARPMFSIKNRKVKQQILALLKSNVR